MYRGTGCRTDSSAAEGLEDAYGGWFSKIRWHTFGTYTFAQRRSVARAGALFAAWLDRPDVSSVLSAVVWGAEPHPGGHGGHVHALIKWHPWLRPGRECIELSEKWRAKYGRCEHRKYDPDRGAAYYLAKYVLKDARGSGVWDVWSWQGACPEVFTRTTYGRHDRAGDDGLTLQAVWETQEEVEQRLDAEEEGRR